MKKLSKEFEGNIAAVILIFITIIMTVQIFMRYVMNNSLSWAEELVLYVFPYFIFFGGAYAVVTKSHIALDALLYLIPRKARLYAVIFGQLLWGFCLAAISFFSFQYFNFLNDTAVVTTALKLPTSISFLGVGLGSIFMFIRVIKSAINNINIMKNGGSFLEEHDNQTSSIENNEERMDIID